LSSSSTPVGTVTCVGTTTPSARNLLLAEPLGSFGTKSRLNNAQIGDRQHSRSLARPFRGGLNRSHPTQPILAKMPFSPGAPLPVSLDPHDPPPILDALPTPSEGPAKENLVVPEGAPNIGLFAGLDL
jgi:hypothetical protein